MIASVKISPEMDLAAVAAAAGNSSDKDRFYSEGRLYVAGVSQEALLVAAANATRPVEPIPTITAAQLRLALLGLGMTGAQVEAAIDAMPGTDMQREAARIQWEYATTYWRDHPLVVAIGAALGLTNAQIDNAWRGAASL